jgi:hypothetical protein
MCVHKLKEESVICASGILVNFDSAAGWWVHKNLWFGKLHQDAYLGHVHVSTCILYCRKKSDSNPYAEVALKTN